MFLKVVLRNLPMNRNYSLYAVFMLVLFPVALCMSCKTSPEQASSARVEKFGAGSMEETVPAPTASKAVAPAAIQKVRNDEAVAQITILEGDIQDALSRRQYSKAIASYESIADLAAGIPAGLTRLADDRSKIEAALDLVRFEAVSIPSETMAGTPFRKDFAVKVYTLDSGVKTPLTGFECTVSSPAGTEVRTTGDDGVLSYTASVPAKSGRNLLQIASTLTSRESALRDSINLRKEKGLLALSFPHIVSASTRKVPTTISILDYDKNGKPVFSNNFSSTTLLMPLVQKGFSRIGMAEFSTQIASGDDVALIKAAKAQFGSGVQRFIYGTVHIDTPVQGSDGLWSCTASGNITVYDFVADVPVYKTKPFATATGKTESSAIEAARKQLAGETLVQDLFYNL
jgi:hypothetical protein